MMPTLPFRITHDILPKNMETKKLTPMMKQYLEIKEEHKDAILFFRMGDFYEMFLEDASVASRELEIALTSRSKEENIPMCGVPFHAADSYISRLIQKGYKVAICEQVEDPSEAEGLVRREVIRIITPGLTTEEGDLEPKENNYLMSLCREGENIGLAFLDLSTGEFKLTQLKGINQLKGEMERVKPRETLFPISDKSLIPFLEDLFQTPLPEEDFSYEGAIEVLEKELRSECLGMKEFRCGIRAAGAIIEYVKRTQKQILSHINTLTPYKLGEYLILDEFSMKNLEIVSTFQEGKKKGSLLGILDETITPMGGRELRKWVQYPLIDVQKINQRLDTVEEFKTKKRERKRLREILKGIYDLERIGSKISLKKANPRDLIALKDSLEKIPEVKEILDAFNSSMLKEISLQMDDLGCVAHAIEETLVDAPPFNPMAGGLIKDGVNGELDELRTISRDGKSWILDLERKERRRTGINSLKTGYNKVFGYYIEVTKPNLDLVPMDYIRKQTLVNCERFITPQLKDYETKVLGAEDRIEELEWHLYCQLVEKISRDTAKIQGLSRKLAFLDVISTFAQVSDDYGYVRPNLDDGDRIEIREGRHPVLERIGSTGGFVPNDTLLDCNENRMLIITGPNMAGKSTVMRQVALIVIMAQMGSFVPAAKAHVGVVDRIFTRVGARDNLLQGQSTFMVEMIETAAILQNATKKSLIIIDEIGRGTSTFDGVSLAWAVAEYIWDKNRIGAKCLFATHYHELCHLVFRKKGIKNYNIAVKEWNDEIVFLRKMVPGSVSRSYGIQVARLAGLPSQVIYRAKEILAGLEKFEVEGIAKIGIMKSQDLMQMPLFHLPHDPVRQKLRQLNFSVLTPQEALNILNKLKEMAEASP